MTSSKEKVCEMVAFPSGEAAGEETVASTVRRRAAAGDAGRGQQGRPGLKRPLKPTGTEPVRQPMVLFSLAAPAVMAASVQAAARGMRTREGHCVVGLQAILVPD